MEANLKKIYTVILICFLCSCSTEDPPEKPESYAPVTNRTGTNQDLKVEEREIIPETQEKTEENPQEDTNNPVIPIEEEENQADTLPDLDEPPVEEAPAEEPKKPMHFNLQFVQTTKSCDGCGMWFDWQDVQGQKPKLSVEYSYNGENITIILQHGLDDMENAFSMATSERANYNSVPHSMRVESNPDSVSYFYADLKEIPNSAEIINANLSLHLNTDDGLAFSDNSSVITIYEFSEPWNFTTGIPDGTVGEIIRTLTVIEDFIGNDISKLNPTGTFDFTEYVKKLQSTRGN